MFKKLISTLLVTTCGVVAPLAVYADYPDKPIRLIVPFAPGGSTDLLARLMADAMNPILGQPLIVENKSGAGGNIGGSFVARSEPDGYTLLLAAAGPTVINPSLYSNMGFSPSKDLAPITALTKEHNLMVVNPSIPAKNLTEFVAYAKENSNSLTFGSPGQGSPAHLAGELLNLKADLDMQHIPYKGTGPAISDLLANTINVMIDNMPPLLPHVKSGAVRPLAVPSANRSAALPDLETFEEQGIEDYIVMSWKGLMAPKGTPPEIIEKVHAAALEVLKRPEIQERLNLLGAEPEGNTPTEFAAQIEQETQWWANLIKETNTVIN